MRAWGSFAILLVLWGVPAGAAEEAVPAAVSQDADSPADAPPDNPAGRRDPFRSFTLDIRPEERGQQVTPLQRYEIGQLTVVATVWEMNPPRAMLEDSVGMGYIVNPGTPIGGNGGVVCGIAPHRAAAGD